MPAFIASSVRSLAKPIRALPRHVPEAIAALLFAIGVLMLANESTGAHDSFHGSHSASHHATSNSG